MMEKIIVFFLVIFFTFLQALGLSFFGVKPNLALAAIIAVAFFVSDVWEGVLLASIAALILKFSPGFSSEILIFFLIIIGAFLAKKYLPWRSIINLLFLIVAATLLFYIFSAPKLILSAIFLLEIVYNIIAGLIIFAALDYLILRRFQSSRHGR